MMKAIVRNQYTGKVEREYIGRSLQEIRRRMNADLAIDGPRSLVALVADGRSKGARIAASLYDGQSWIQDKSGRTIWRG